MTVKRVYAFSCKAWNLSSLKLDTSNNLFIPVDVYDPVFEHIELFSARWKFLIVHYYSEL